MAHHPARRSRLPGVETLEGRRLLSGLGVEKSTPMSASMTIAGISDPLGDGFVSKARVMLVGTTAPGSKVRLVEGAALAGPTTHANARGQFRMAVAVGIGQNTIRVLATNPAGQQATAIMTVSRGDVVVTWNRMATDLMRVADENVGMMSRNMAIVGSAMYDAIDDIQPAQPAFKFAIRPPAGASAEAAASSAAYQVLLGLYPKQKATLDADLAETAGTLAAGRSKALGMAFGRKIAANYLAWRAGDGSDAEPAYKVGTAPGQWRPTPPDYRNAWGPAWGDVTPFALPSASAFDPLPPPALDSPEYAAALDQVESLGAVDSTTRTADQTQAGLFWAYDTAGTGPPVVFYNQALEQIALQRLNTLAQNARLFALADVAMADAGIVAWQSKYDDALWRPVTAIQQADTDGNPATTADPTWMPLGSPGEGILPNYTPPFPSYVSGHATFGGALFTVLADFYGTDSARFHLTSDEVPGVTRSFDSFSAASEENAMSRIYLGIHFSFDASAGIASGDAIGNYVFENEMS